MSKCKQCDTDFEGRADAKYCSGKCRVAAHRVTDNSVTDNVTDKDLEKCRYCGEVLPALQEPRQYPGACYACAIKPHKKSKEVSNIKTFEDLPPAVQRTIETMSQRADHPVKDKAARTARAIHYQHLYPDRFHSTGLL